MSASQTVSIRFMARAILFAVLMVSLVVGCSKDSRYRKRERETVGGARHLSYEWKAARMRELYPNAEILKVWEEELVDKIREKDLNWRRDGDEIVFSEVIGKIGEERSEKLRSVDGWGRAYEFRVIDGFLAVRSSGADRAFDSDVYRHGSFPWLSGGDLVIVGGKAIRWTVPPKAPDWLEDSW